MDVHESVLNRFFLQSLTHFIITFLKLIGSVTGIKAVFRTGFKNK